MSLETQSPDTPTSSFDAHVDDVLSLQDSGDAARRLEAAQDSKPVQQAPQPTEAQPANPQTPNRGRRAGMIVTGIAGVTAGLAAGGILGSADANMHHDTAETIGSTSFTPSAEYGDLIGPANEAVDDLLEQNGIDPGTIPYETVQTELAEATDELAELRGSSMVGVGEPFDVDLITSNGLTGVKTVSVDITPAAVNRVAPLPGPNPLDHSNE